MADSSLKHEIDNLQSDLSQLRNDLVGLTKVISALTANTANESLADAKRAGERMQERLQETAADVKSSIEEQVAERPLATILLAFGIGLLLGKVAHRS